MRGWFDIRHLAAEHRPEARRDALLLVINGCFDNQFTLQETGNGRTGFLLLEPSDGQGLAGAGLGLGGGRPKQEANIVRCQRRSHLYKYRPPGLNHDTLTTLGRTDRAVGGRAFPEISCPRQGTCRTVISKPTSHLQSNFMAGNLSSWYLLRREFCKESRDTFRFLVALLVPRPPFFAGNLSYYCVLVMYPLVLFTEKNTPSVPRCPINLPPFNFEFMLDACGTLVLRLQSCTSLTFGSEITKISEISATAERPVRRCSNLVHCHIRYPSVVKLGCARSGGKKLASLEDPTKYGGPGKSSHQTLLGQARCTLQGQVRLQEHEKGTELLKCGEIFGKRHPHTRREGWQGNTC